MAVQWQYSDSTVKVCNVVVWCSGAGVLTV